MINLQKSTDPLAEIIEMERTEVVEQIVVFERGEFHLDFTPEFLAEQSLKELQHILAGAVSV